MIVVNDKTMQYVKGTQKKISNIILGRDVKDEGKFLESLTKRNWIKVGKSRFFLKDKYKKYKEVSNNYSHRIKGEIKSDGLFYPFKDPSYIYRDIDDTVITLLERGKIPLLYSGAGTGKSKLVEQISAINDLPFFSCSLDGSMAVSDLLGKHTLENGHMLFREGEFVRYLRVPSFIELAELNSIIPNWSFKLHDLFQTGKIYSQEADQTYYQHPECMIVCTANKTSSAYIGTQKLNEALLDRLVLKPIPRFDFNLIDIRGDEKTANTVREFADDLYKLLESKGAKTTVSIRGLVNYNDLYDAFPLDEVIKLCFLNRIDFSDENVYSESWGLAKSRFNLSDINDEEDLLKT
jgi:MoxR-like ATPase